jgi:hypothetical protein
LFIIYGCNNEPATVSPKTPLVYSDLEVGNDHSYANSNQIESEHIQLELDIHFNTQTVYGIARHTLKRHRKDTIVFDIDGLQIQKVTTGPIGREKNTDYAIGNEDSLHGAPLSVRITPNTRFVSIYYQTTEKSNSLHWINDPSNPSSTDYLYTLPGEKYTRTWIPLQDNIHQKISYSADIRSDRPLLPIMSNSIVATKIDSVSFHINNSVPVHTYDLGLFMGNYVYSKISSRIGVYAPGKRIRHAVRELKNTPTLLTNAEHLLGKHPWETFNFLVLPSYFPHTSYDYPSLSCINPIMLGKQQQSTEKIQNYLFQTWPKNLFSTKCERYRQINIGINKYLTNRTLYGHVGSETELLATKLFMTSVTHPISQQQTPLFKLTNHYFRPCTESNNFKQHDRLMFQLKGYLFLRNLELNLGKQNFEHFLGKSIQKNKTISFDEFAQELNHFLIQHDKLTLLTSQWAQTSRIQRKELIIPSKRHTQIHLVCKTFLTSKKSIFKNRKTRNIVKTFKTEDWKTFVSLLPSSTTPNKLAWIESHLHFSKHPNNELKNSWLNTSIECNYWDILPAVKTQLLQTGNTEYLYNTYALLFKKNPEWCRKVYAEASTNYSLETKKALEKIF